MSRHPWASQALLGYDTETTGTNPHEARIVQAAAVKFRPDVDPETWTCLVDPGIDIPDEAAAVHGITTERARAEGMDPRDAMSVITQRLTAAMRAGVPVVIANAPYDITITEAENRRHGITSLADHVQPYPIGPIIDPQVLDQQLDPYRRNCYKADGCDPETRVHTCGGCQGSRVHDCGGCGATDRTLTSLCAHYGIELDNAHDAASDALAAVLLARRLVCGYPRAFGSYTPGRLHMAQIKWRAAQADRLREFFDRVGKEHDGVPGDWPLLPTPVLEEVGR